MNDVVPTQTRSPILAGGSVSAIIPRSIDECYRVAQAVCTARMYPDDCKGSTDQETASRVMMKIMKGSEVGFPPMTALATILIVNNRVAIWGDGALALCQNHRDFEGCREWFEGEMNLTEKSNWVAKCEISRRVGTEIKTTTRQFSWSDAMRAALNRKGTYQQYPGRMLQMRARAWTIRDSFADALSGLGIVEEVQDIPQKAAEVSSAFLDVATDTIPRSDGHVDNATVPDATAETSPQAAVPDNPPVIAEPEVSVDHKSLLQSIKKNFIQAGDDVEKIKQVIDAAEGLNLPEPFGAELATIINAKKTRVENG